MGDDGSSGPHQVATRDGTGQVHGLELSQENCVDLRNRRSPFPIKTCGGTASSLSGLRHLPGLCTFSNLSPSAVSTAILVRAGLHSRMERSPCCCLLSDSLAAPKSNSSLLIVKAKAKRTSRLHPLRRPWKNTSPPLCVLSSKSTIPSPYASHYWNSFISRTEIQTCAFSPCRYSDAAAR